MPLTLTMNLVIAGAYGQGSNDTGGSGEPPSDTGFATQTALWPNLTPAGQGGWMPFDSSGNRRPLASVDDQTGATRTWSIDTGDGAGQLIANGTPAVDDGVNLTVTDTGGNQFTVPISVPVDSGEAFTNWTEIITAWSTASRLNGMTHLVRSKTIQADTTNLNNRHEATSVCVWKPEDTGVPAILVDALFPSGASTANATFQDLWFYRAQDTGANSWNPSDPAYGVSYILNIGQTQGFTFTRGRVYSNYQAEGGGYLIHQRIDGVATATTTENLTLDGVEFDHHYLGMSIRGISPTVRNNTFHDLHGDAINFFMDTGVLLVEGNRMWDFSGCASHIHQDYIQCVGANKGDLIVRGNAAIMGVTSNKMRPGDDQTAANVNTDTGITLTVATHANRIVVLKGGQTYTLPAVSTCDDEDFIMYTDSGTATVVPDGADTHVDTGVFPASVAGIANTFSVHSNGTNWTERSHGIRARTLMRDTGHTLDAATHAFRVLRYDTSTHDITVFADTGSDTGDWFSIEPDADTGKLTFNPNGMPMQRYDKTISTHVMEGYHQGSTFTWNGSTWVVTDMVNGMQGFFSNALVTSGKLEFYGNLFEVNQTWGFRYEGDTGNIPNPIDISYNTLYMSRVAPFDTGENRAYSNRFGPQFGTETTIEQRGAFTTTYKNFTTGPIDDPLGGATEYENTELQADTGSAQGFSDYQTHFTGSSFSDFTATTIAELISITTYDTGSPRYAATPNHGAHGYWDFSTNTKRTLAVPGNPSVPSTVGVGQIITVTLDGRISTTRGTGNLTIYNVDSMSNHEQYNVATDTGSFVIIGDEIRIEPTTPLTGGTNYSIRWDATAFDSHFDTGDIAAVTDNSLAFVAEAPVFPDLALLQNTQDQTAGTQFEDTGWIYDTGANYIIAIHARSSAGGDPVIGTVTIGEPNRTFGTGTALDTGDVVALNPATSGNAHVYVYKIEEGRFTDTGTSSIQVDFTNSCNGASITINEAYRYGGIGAVDTGERNSGITHDGTLTTTGSNSLAAMAATSNGVGITHSTTDSGVYLNSVPHAAGVGSLVYAQAETAGAQTIDLESSASAYTTNVMFEILLDTGGNPPV